MQQSTSSTKPKPRARGPSPRPDLTWHELQHIAGLIGAANRYDDIRPVRHRLEHLRQRLDPNPGDSPHHRLSYLCCLEILRDLGAAVGQEPGLLLTSKWIVDQRALAKDAVGYIAALLHLGNLHRLVPHNIKDARGCVEKAHDVLNRHSGAIAHDRYVPLRFHADHLIVKLAIEGGLANQVLVRKAYDRACHLAIELGPLARQEHLCLAIGYACALRDLRNTDPRLDPETPYAGLTDLRNDLPELQRPLANFSVLRAQRTYAHSTGQIQEVSRLDTEYECLYEVCWPSGYHSQNLQRFGRNLVKAPAFHSNFLSSNYATWSPLLTLPNGFSDPLPDRACSFIGCSVLRERWQSGLSVGQAS